MNFFIHNGVFGRAFAFLFLLASSGYTVAFYHCEMPGGTKAMACCRTSGAGPAQSSATVPPGEKAIRADFAPCVVLEVAGGLQLQPTVLEKAHSTNYAKNLFHAPLPAETVGAAPAQPASSSPCKFLSNAPHRSVEAYVLNAALLI